MVVVGIFFIRRQLSSRTAATGGFTAYPAVFLSICTSVCSFCALNAGNGFLLLPQTVLSGESKQVYFDTVAVSNDGDIHWQAI